jgi:YfiH family protein
LEAIPGLVHGFSTRDSGFPGRDFDLARSATAQRRFARAVFGGEAARRLGRSRGTRSAHDASELPPVEPIQLRQIHSGLVWQDPKPGTAGDAAFSRTLGRLLAIRTADCLPILLADSTSRAFAAVHAGWRGTLNRIVEKTVGEMFKTWATQPANLRVAIGPGIRACCYEVGEEVIAAFDARFDYVSALVHDVEDDPLRTRYPMLFLTGAPPGHPYDPRWNPQHPRRLDLAEANRRQLVAAGVPADAIDVLPYCTACHPELFFSHRRGERGRMLSAIGRLAQPPAASRPRSVQAAVAD